MYGLDAIRQYALAAWSRHKRQRLARVIQTLSPEIRKDIGWPSGEGKPGQTLVRFKRQGVNPGQFH